MGHHKDLQAAHKPHALAHGHASGHHTPAGFSPYPHLLPHHAHSNLGSAKSEGSRSVDDLGFFPPSTTSPGSGGTAPAPHPLAGLGYGPKYALPPLLTRSPSSTSLSSNTSQPHAQPNSAGPLSSSSARPHAHSHLSDVSYPWPQGSPAVPAPSTPSFPVPPKTPAMSEAQFLKAFQAALGGGTSSAPVPAALGSSSGTPEVGLGQNDLDDASPVGAGVDEFTFGTAHAPSYWPGEAVVASAAVATSAAFNPLYAAATNYAPTALTSPTGPAAGSGYVPVAGPAEFDFVSWARSTSGYAASTNTTGTDHPEWPSARSDFSAVAPTSNAWEQPQQPQQQRQQQQPQQQQHAFSSAYDGSFGQLSLGTGGGDEFDELSVERWRTHAAYLDAQGGTDQGGFGAPLRQISSISSVTSWTSASAVPSSAAAMNQLNLASQAQFKQEEDVYDDGPGLSPTFEKEFELDPQWALNHPSHPHHQLSPDQWLPLDDEGPLAKAAAATSAASAARAAAGQRPYPDQGPSAAFGTMRSPNSFDAFFNAAASSAAGSEASFSLGQPPSRPHSAAGFAGGAGDYGPQGEGSMPLDLLAFPELGLEEAKDYGGAGATPRYEPDFAAQDRRRREGTVTDLVPGWAVKEEEEDRKPDIRRA